MNSHHPSGRGEADHAHDGRGVEQEIASLRFAYKDGRLFWELRSETVEQGEPRITLVLNLPVNGIGEVQQTFPLSQDNQFQIVMWLARQLEVELPSLPHAGRRAR